MFYLKTVFRQDCVMLHYWLNLFMDSDVNETEIVDRERQRFLPECELEVVHLFEEFAAILL